MPMSINLLPMMMMSFISAENVGRIMAEQCRLEEVSEKYFAEYTGRSVNNYVMRLSHCNFAHLTEMRGGGSLQ